MPERRKEEALPTFELDDAAYAAADARNDPAASTRPVLPNVQLLLQLDES